MELTERLAATLGHVYESSRRRSTVGHHPAAVKAELVAAGLMKQVGWKKHIGPVYEVTPEGCEAYKKYEEERRGRG